MSRTPKELFQSKAIQALVNEYLSGLLLEIPLDLSKLTAQEMATAKEYARSGLENAIIRSEIRRIIDAAKDAVACSAQNDVEVAFNRGIVQGLKLLENSLKNYLAGSKSKRT